jgi:hypothetical protein
MSLKVINMGVESKVNLKSKSKQKSVKVDVETYEKIKYISKTLGSKQARFLKELIDEVFSVCGTFSTANVSYMPCISSSYLYVQFSGRNRLICSKGNFSDSEGEAELNKKIKEELVIA